MLAPHIAKQNKWLTAFIIFSVLLLPNVTLFLGHYLGNAVFPWDCLQLYPSTYFWITAAQAHLLPSWIAQAASGYPLAMNVQNGMYYPPFYLFVLTGISYSAHAAIVLQCLHVLLGSLGIYYLLRLQQFPLIYCLIAGVAYQFFGGFVGQEEHSEYIIGYGLIPWMMVAAVYLGQGIATVRNVILLPFIVFCLITGGYVGLAIASFVSVGLWVLVQLIVTKKVNDKAKLTYFAMICLMIFIGMMLTAAKLLPPWMMKSELLRSQNFADNYHVYVQPFNFFTLFANPFFPKVFQARSMPQYIPMQPFFITLPLFSCLFFISVRVLKKHMDYVALFLFAMIMATHNPLRIFLEHMVPPLNYSRFPVADYRAFVCIPLIVLGIASLKDFLDESALAKKNMLLRLSAFIVIVISARVLMGHSDLTYLKTIMLFYITAFVISLEWLVFLKKIDAKLFLYAFLCVTLVDGARVWFSNGIPWGWDPSVHSMARNYFQDNYKFPDALITKSNLAAHLSPQSNRPARLKSLASDNPLTAPATDDPNFPMRGYLTGDFMVSDYTGGGQLKRANLLIQNTMLRKFMLRPSDVLLFPEQKSISSAELMEAIQANVKSQSVRIQRFSNDKLEYQVNLSTPAMMVENEAYFPGWRGQRIAADKSIRAIDPIPINNALRGWALPAGNYRLIISFEMPYVGLAQKISLLALCIWGLIIFICLPRTSNNIGSFW